MKIQKQIQYYFDYMEKQICKYYSILFKVKERHSVPGDSIRWTLLAQSYQGRPAPLGLSG